jgi:quinol monooxygenase YgiN
MTVEYIRYALTQHRPDELVAAYAAASRHLKDASECLGFELSQCSEDSTQFILRIDWVSAAAHTEQFRQGPHFLSFSPIFDRSFLKL